jgi:hypothetical protein
MGERLMTVFIVLALLASHAGAGYLGYRKGSKVVAMADQIKTDLGAFKKP